jgi:hypothetical protein
MKRWAWGLRTLEDFKPDVVALLGDVINADSTNAHHDDSADHDLLDEYRAADGLLGSIRETVGRGTRLVWLFGNHEHALLKADTRRTKKSQRRALSPQAHMEELKRDRWEVIPYGKGTDYSLRLGPVIFKHGVDVSGNADELEAIQFSNLHGMTNTLVVGGHTHRPVPVTQAMRTRRIPLPYHYGNVGTMADVRKLVYAQTVDTFMWGAAMGLGDAGADGWGAEIRYYPKQKEAA